MLLQFSKSEIIILFQVNVHMQYRIENKQWLITIVILPISTARSVAYDACAHVRKDMATGSRDPV